MTNNSNNIMLEKHKTFTGTVVSDKNDKTIIVSVETARRHRIYQKRVKSTKKYHAHDEHNQAQIGDLVKIIETRPLSALKRFRLLKIIKTQNIITKEANKD